MIVAARPDTAKLAGELGSDALLDNTTSAITTAPNPIFNAKCPDGFVADGRSTIGAIRCSVVRPTGVARHDSCAEQPARIAATNAPGVANRRSGVLASARVTAADSPCGTFGMLQQSGIGSAEMWRVKTSFGAPLNGG